ncbi:MAG: OB-fold domain-containing protein [Acidimicrobiales bacterium]|nr:OB-fold domain-containing protein [Acidimicrobiales bacterium]
MRGIIASGAYIPHRRLDRAEITALFGKGGGRGTRSVAGFDEDTTTMGAEAARNALRDAGDVSVDSLWFATSTPAYLEKTNAAAIHAALRLDPSVGALDLGGALRSGIGTVRTALQGGGTTLVVCSDVRDGMATSADEASGGDGAAALLIGDESAGPVIAEYVGAGIATDEFLERWRVPGAARSRVWEERFGEVTYAPLMKAAFDAALADAGIEADAIDHLAVAGLHARAIKRGGKAFGAATEHLVDDLSATVGNTGTAHPALLLAATLEQAEPGQTIAVAMLADGVEVVILRTTDAIANYSPSAPVSAQAASGAPIDYGKFLSWRGMVAVEPPNRPPPQRTSASAAYRRNDWKFAFVGTRDRSSGMLHMPPARVSQKGGAVDDMEPVPMADTVGTIASFTIDKLVYSPSPPVVFAVVDFDGGGRAPLELTDVDPDEVEIGGRVEPTFRRLSTSDEIHNYFWKVRPVRGES